MGGLIAGYLFIALNVVRVSLGHMAVAGNAAIRHRNLVAMTQII